tara:strand:+ start:80 stop:1510 length:1431 start_codon:yes stop_codon:yes gene_type:complete
MKISKIIIALMLCSQAITASSPQEELVEACKKMDLQLVKKAFEKGADVKSLDADGKSILSHAYYSAEITEFLISKGADPNAGSYPALVAAAANSSDKVIDLLLKAGAKPQLPASVKNQSTDQISKMIKDMEEKAEKAKGKTKKIYLDGVAQLRAQYPDIDKGLNFYALNMVVQNTNCTSCLESLLKAGAKINAEDGASIIHLYASYAQTQEERQARFLEGKKNMEAYGYSLPDWYSNMNSQQNGKSSEILNLLLSAGGDINAKDVGGKTALHYALAGGVGSKSEVLLNLLNAGADIHIEDPVFGKCFTLAAKTGLVPVAKKMVEMGADIGETSKINDVNLGQRLSGATPLIAATMHNHLEMIKYLVSLGASIKEDAEGFSFNSKTGCATSVRNKSAIYFAIDNQNMEIIKYFVEVSGLTWYRPLHINQLKQKSVSQMGNIQITSTRCYGKGDYKPGVYAKKMGQKEIYKYLKKHDL